MKKHYDAVVVGGGISGLTAAAYLSRSDIDFILLEKSDTCGGLVQSFEKEGFVFDAGARAFVSSGIIQPMLEELGIEMPCRENPVTLGLKNERTDFRSREDLARYSASLASLFPQNKADIRAISDEINDVTEELSVLFSGDNPLFREDTKDPEYLKNQLLPWFLRFLKSMVKIKKYNVPVYDYLARFTENTALIDMIAQHFFRGTPAFFALSYFTLYRDYFYPEGGTGRLTTLLEAYIRENGGAIRSSCEVLKIIPGEHRIVCDQGEEIRYKQMIWAADENSLYSRCEGKLSRKARKRRTLCAEADAADSVFTVFLAADIPPAVIAEKIGVHAFLTPRTEGLSSLDKHKEGKAYWQEFLEKTTYEISCPVLRDKTLAPPGQSGLIISSLADYDRIKAAEEAGHYEALKSYCTEKIIEEISRFFLPELKEKQLFSLASTPLSIERRTGNKQGGLSGWSFLNETMPSAHSFLQMPGSIKTPFEDILQAGQWAFSPAGIPTCILSGRLAADKVSEALKA